MPRHLTHTPYRGRFAPSPTGPLHLGSLFTAVASFLQARANQGNWLVRIDDLDATRCQPQYADRILNTLTRFGLHWDESVFYQSNRGSAYLAALEQLKQNDHLYACACSRKAIRARSPDNSIDPYDGHCQTLNLPFDGHALRCRVSEDTTVCNDRVQGPYRQCLAHVTGDFIVRRRDQIAAYHLAVVIDDHHQGITEVFRGIDLLESTPRQIHLQRLLGLPTPAYAHIPVLVDEQGDKLSKQTFAEDVLNASPSKTWQTILEALGFTPPSGLCQEPPQLILEWGIKHWSLDLLPQTTKITTHSLKALQ